MKVVIASLCALCFVGAHLLESPLAQATRNTEWRTYGGDPGHRKHSELDQISKANVSNLRVAWRWVSVDDELRKQDPRFQDQNDRTFRTYLYEVTPLMIGGVLYTTTSLGQIAAIDAATGVTRWRYDPGLHTGGRPPVHGFLTRGLAYWTDGKRERLFYTGGLAYLFSVDAKTGRPDPAFGENGRLDLKQGLGRVIVPSLYTANSAPAIAGNVVIVGSAMPENMSVKEMPPGHVRGFDVLTGKMKWIFHTIPRPGEFGNETWEADSWATTGGVNVWTNMSVDPQLGYVYIPVGTPTNDFYGGERLGDNLFADSLLCLNAETGRRVWHFQFVHHPIWDYDPPAAPTLVDITVDGRPIKAVAQVTKQGFIFVFDRVTGAPVWPIEERPVASSSLPGERTAATQPFPTKPPPFVKFGVTEDDVIDFTPELKAEALAILKKYDFGPPYTPPSDRGTIVKPGYSGGANWWGAAFDPETGYMYVPSWAAFSMAALKKQDPARSPAKYAPASTAGSGLSGVDGPRGLPLFKPPYSAITAYDLNKGEQLWAIPHGDGPRDHPELRHLNLPPLGSFEKPGGPLLTRTLLFIGQGLLSSKFRAFDKRTGERVWETDLPAKSSAAPITYLLNGKQFIVIAVGGGDQREELVAFSLP